MQTFSRLINVGASLAALVLCAAASSHAQASRIPPSGVVQPFTVAGARTASPSPGRVGGRLSEGGPRVSLRVQLDVLEQAGRASARVAVPLPDGLQVVAQLTKFEAQESGFVAEGPLVDGETGVAAEGALAGEATFTVFDGALVGRIIAGRRLFIIRRDAESRGLHVIIEINQATIPPELPPLSPPPR